MAVINSCETHTFSAEMQESYRHLRHCCKSCPNPVLLKPSVRSVQITTWATVLELTMRGVAVFVIKVTQTHTKQQQPFVLIARLLNKNIHVASGVLLARRARRVKRAIYKHRTTFF